MRRIGLVGFLAGGLLLLASHYSFGQGMGGMGGGGSGGGGGFGSSSGGGFSGSGFGTSSGGGFAGSGFGSSSGGGFAGSGFGSSSGGGFAGGGFGTSSGGGFAGGGGGGATGLGGFSTTTQYGTTSVFGKYLGNPYAAGMATGRTNSAASQYARTFPVTLSFGQPVYTTPGTRTGTTGLTGLTGLGAGSAAAANRAFSASSAGIRRAPGYLSEPVFDVPPRSRAELIRPDLQSLISRTDRLPSAAGIRVSSDGDTVVLRGRVTSERERRLAEAMIRLTPGVRDVRNELEPPSSP